MKVVLVVLILAIFIHATSAILWYNRQSNERKTTPGSVQRSTLLQQNKQLQNGTQLLRQPVIASNKNNTNKSPLQRVVNGQRILARNTTAAVQRQADSIRKNGSQVIPQNRFQAIAYQQQNRALKTAPVNRQTNRTLNNANKQMINPKYRYISQKNKTNATAINAANRRAFLAALFSESDMAHSKANGSLIAKNKTQQVQSRLLPGKAVVTNVKSNLLRALTTKVAGNNGNLPRQSPLVDSYYEAKLRTLHREMNEPQNRALKKRWTQLEIEQADPVYPMILARDEPLDTKK